MGATEENAALSPAQQTAFNALEGELAGHNVAVLSGHEGPGRTRILRALHARTGGAYLTTREFVEASAQRDPLALDETIYAVLSRAIEQHQTVIVDDFHFISFVSCCTNAYPRQNAMHSYSVGVGMAEGATSFDMSFPTIVSDGSGEER